MVRLVRPATPARERKPTKYLPRKTLRWAMPIATAAALVVIGLLGAQVAHLNDRVRQAGCGSLRAMACPRSCRPLF